MEPIMLSEMASLMRIYGGGIRSIQRGHISVSVKGSADKTPVLTEVPISAVNPDKCELFVDVNIAGIGSNDLDYSITLTSSKIQISTVASNALFSKPVSAVWQVIEHY